MWRQFLWCGENGEAVATPVTGFYEYGGTTYVSGGSCRAVHQNFRSEATRRLLPTGRKAVCPHGRGCRGLGRSENPTLFIRTSGAKRQGGFCRPAGRPFVPLEGGAGVRKVGESDAGHQNFRSEATRRLLPTGRKAVCPHGRGCRGLGRSENPTLFIRTSGAKRQGGFCRPAGRPFVPLEGGAGVRKVGESDAGHQNFRSEATRRLLPTGRKAVCPPGRGCRG